MSFPVHPDNRAGQAVLTPQAMIAYRQRSGLLPVMEAPSAVILCLQRGLPERMRGRYPLRRVARLMGDLFLLKRSRGAVAVMTNFGIGAPQMAALAEELIAWGARRLVSLSMAGAPGRSSSAPRRSATKGPPFTHWRRQNPGTRIPAYSKTWPGPFSRLEFP